MFTGAAFMGSRKNDSISGSVNAISLQLYLNYLPTSKWIKIKCFFIWANPGLFFIYFHLSKLALQFLQQINVK